MKLWIQWLHAVRCLHQACARSLTFLWMTLVLIGLCCRSDNLGVTSFERVLNLSGDSYHRFLHMVAPATRSGVAMNNVTNRAPHNGREYLSGFDSATAWDYA